MNANNHLKMPILDILHENMEGISEYELIKQLKRKIKSDPILTGQFVGILLFQQHFLVMNALYQLQTELRQDNKQLSISPNVIRIKLSNATHTQQLDNFNGLASYYLDWSNYYNTTESDVDNMLHSFWDMLMQDTHREEALKILGLPLSATVTDIRKNYLKLVSDCHPDKGGESHRFREVQQAYELLMSNPLGH